MINRLLSLLRRFWQIWQRDTYPERGRVTRHVDEACDLFGAQFEYKDGEFYLLLPE